ncbi:MAG TPA: CVNH domain-containing protein [Candidatus Angelobacter sp.]
MRNATIVGTVTLFLVLCAIPSVAQDDDRRGSIPRGNYVQSCRNIHIQGDRLVAECQEGDGDWRRTSLDDFNRCSGEIVNNNGNLVCDQGRGGYGYDNGRRSGWQGGIPNGTYTETCRNIHVDGDRLEAECQKRNGDWRRTSLDDLDRCASAPANDNGRLVCGR